MTDTTCCIYCGRDTKRKTSICNVCYQGYHTKEERGPRMRRQPSGDSHPFAYVDPVIVSAEDERARANARPTRRHD